MDAQRRYWDTFTNLKRDSIYINRYQGKVENTDRCINIFAAVTSSTAIGGWVIWQSLSFLWAFIIAAAQVLNAVKSQLPYRSRLSALNSLGPDLEGLAITAEADWFKVCTGLLTDEEIYQLAMTLKRKAQQATQKNFKGSSLPEDRNLLELADRDTKAYMGAFSSEDEP